MSKQFFGIYPWLALIALFLGGCQSVPVAVESIPSDTPQMAETPAAGATLEPGFRAPLWTFSTDGEIWSSPAVQDGVVYFGSDDHFLYALDLRTRKLKWKFEAGDIVRSRPAVAGGTVFFTADDNQLYALNRQSGKAVWKFDMGKPFAARSPIPKGWDYMQSSPAVAGGVVYVGSAGSNFFAVDGKTGKEKWRVPVGLYVRSSPAVVDGVVYFGDWLGKFYALDAQTGQAKWSVNTYGSVVPSPTVVDGVVYIGSKFPCLFAFDAKTGEQKWCFAYPSTLAWVESSAVVADGVVYVGSSDWDRVNAVDAATGELKWFFATKGDPWCSPAVSDGVVYIGATGGFLYALDAAGGAEKWRVRTAKGLTTVDERFDGGVVSSPVVVDGVVYFGGLDGKLYAVSTAA
jgi:outer membrane protein assembly factor BamB